MYVLRSKVTIEVQSLLQLYGVTHTTKLDLADQDNYFQYELPSITLDGQIINRKIFATPRDVNISCNSDPAIWNWLEVASGYPRVTLATSEQFVPQMINFESVGGVDFKKGCYPGQETVAKINNLGTPPRKLVLLHLDGLNVDLPKSGDKVFDGEKEVGFIGTVVRHFELGPIGLAVLRKNVPIENTLVVDGVSATQEAINK